MAITQFIPLTLAALYQSTPLALMTILLHTSLSLAVVLAVLLPLEVVVLADTKLAH
tara:strand:+ start:304 stop:471 length:168 start_codon:yes stop_codon:yes gene_type:complete